jgi:hypothetical protein
MTLPLKPRRGGFLRSFGCAWFIREFLWGHGPYGSPLVSRDEGSPQAIIFYHYKQALRRTHAEDRATRDEEREATRAKRPIDPDRIDELTEKYLASLPYKQWRCRYHSFIVYFSNLQRLGWVEATGREEASAFQDHYTAGQPKRYFRLTTTGMEASDADWANPLAALYGRRNRIRPR